MERILVAWIGGLDIDEGSQGNAGPVHTTFVFNKFTQAHLLYNYAAKDKDASTYVSWLKQQPVAKNTQLKSYFTPLTSPQDFGEIYQASEKLLAKIQKQNPKAKITLQITPGPPAMQAVWILLGKTKFQVEFLQGSREHASADKGSGWYILFAEPSNKFLSFFDRNINTTWFHRFSCFNKDFFTKNYYLKPLISHFKSNLWLQGATVETLDAQTEQKSRVNHMDNVYVSGNK